METITNDKQIEIILACLTLNFAFYDMVKQIRNAFPVGVIEANRMVKAIIKELARDNNYKAITFCYESKINY